MKLLDFGTAKFLDNVPRNRTYSLIGTAHYLPPEVFSGKGYTFTADLWALGITVYEFFCGQFPYGEDLENPYEIYVEITKTKEIEFPYFFKDKNAKDFICQLLNKAPDGRLGGSYAALKAHKFFNNVDFVIPFTNLRKNY